MINYALWRISRDKPHSRKERISTVQQRQNVGLPQTVAAKQRRNAKRSTLVRLPAPECFRLALIEHSRKEHKIHGRWRALPGVLEYMQNALPCSGEEQGR